MCAWVLETQAAAGRMLDLHTQRCPPGLFCEGHRAGAMPGGTAGMTLSLGAMQGQGRRAQSHMPLMRLLLLLGPSASWSLCCLSHQESLLKVTAWPRLHGGNVGETPAGQPR